MKNEKMSSGVGLQIEIGRCGLEHANSEVQIRTPCGMSVGQAQQDCLFESRRARRSQHKMRAVAAGLSCRIRVTEDFVPEIKNNLDIFNTGCCVMIKQQSQVFKCPSS